MNKPLSAGELPRHGEPAIAGVFALAAAIMLACVSVGAAQTSATFDVNIRLTPSAQTGVCTNGKSTAGVGELPSVVCGFKQVGGSPATGSTMPQVPIQVGTYRFLMRDELVRALDSYNGVGTSTSFRVVNLRDWEYIEMTVGW